jgi:hypothetical protein
MTRTVSADHLEVLSSFKEVVPDNSVVGDAEDEADGCGGEAGKREEGEVTVGHA